MWLGSQSPDSWAWPDPREAAYGAPRALSTHWGHLMERWEELAPASLCTQPAARWVAVLSIGRRWWGGWEPACWVGMFPDMHLKNWLSELCVQESAETT